MVVTMIGMQEARARAPANPTALLGSMTAAFAIGQLAGPLFRASSTCCRSDISQPSAMPCAGRATLVLSAAYLVVPIAPRPSD